MAPRYFVPLEQTDFQHLEHAHYLKGLLKPFKGKGPLEDWANQCAALRDDLIRLALHHVLAVLVSPRKHQRVFRTPFPPRMRGAFFCRRRPGYAAPPRPLFGSCGRPP